MSDPESAPYEGAGPGAGEAPRVRPGVRIGIDVGTVRIGVARSDATATLAFPVATVPRGPGDVSAILALAAELGASELLVGLPLTLRGQPGRAADAARDFGRRLAGAGTLPVRLVDERFTSVAANRNLRAAGRNARSSRAVVDQEAAVLILTYALDSERVSGQPAGELLEEPE